MIFEYFSKNKKVLLSVSIIVLVLGIFVFFYSPVIFQEGNPWPQIKGIAQLTFGVSDMVKLSSSDTRYLTKSQSSWDIVDDFLKNKGYEFTEQMGSGYFYKSSDSSIVLVRRQYSRFYVIWTITENNLAEKLKDCLPKSDTTSYERCSELLDTIRNFDDCVNAGFSIMKSNPPQCATPDDRNFTDETNSDWSVVLIAIKNCEVESVFQTHSKLVTLKLKNGNKVTAYEPQIDDVMDVVESLNGKCGDIRLATE